MELENYFIGSEWIKPSTHHLIIFFFILHIRFKKSCWSEIICLFHINNYKKVCKKIKHTLNTLCFCIEYFKIYTIILKIYLSKIWIVGTGDADRNCPIYKYNKFSLIAKSKVRSERFARLCKNNINYIFIWCGNKTPQTNDCRHLCRYEYFII